MSEHYTRNTLECTAWCRVCQRNTQHRVDQGRKGPCLEHGPKVGPDGLSKAQRQLRERQARARMNPTLFEKGGADK